METDLITIDGRRFQGVSQELSGAQDDYIVGHLRLAGALELLVSTDNDPEMTAEALLTKIMVSGQGPYVLAGCLTEAGKKWSFEEATRNAGVFASTTKNEDKQAMRAAMVGFVVGFFRFATAYVKISQKSSRPN